MRLIREALAPRVTGLSVLEGERIWQAMFALSHTYRNRKLLMEAIACVDCAVWDVAGKAAGLGVCELLGGKRRALPIISIGGYYVDGKTLGDIGREMEAYRRAGMAGCKFKVGGLTPEDDARRAEVARRADVGQPTHAQGRDDRSVPRARLGARAGRGDDPAVSGRSALTARPGARSGHCLSCEA